MTEDFRVGLGFDIHPLVPQRKLVLGGVEVPFDRGLGGWSDADVLAHAIVDALLGAANLGDIGRHFPSGNPEFRDISGLVLLARVKEKLNGECWTIGNLDAIIIAEKPKLADFIGPMRHNIADALDLDADRVSVKAKTTNEVGPIGCGEGIAAQAVALIFRVPDYKTRGEKVEDI